MTRIIGIDPSLTGTGLAFVDTDDHLVIRTRTIASKAPAGATVQQRLSRLRSIYWTVAAEAGAAGRRCDLAVIEAPAYSSRTGHQHDRSGLWWGVVNALWEVGIPVAEVAPTSRAKYATGKGNASKDAVLLAVARRYPHVAVANNNEADALVLAAIGAHLVGHPIDELPKTHLDALAKITRPAGFAA